VPDQSPPPRWPSTLNRDPAGLPNRAASAPRLAGANKFESYETFLSDQPRMDVPSHETPRSGHTTGSSGGLHSQEATPEGASIILDPNSGDRTDGGWESWPERCAGPFISNDLLGRMKQAFRNEFPTQHSDRGVFHFVEYEAAGQGQRNRSS
jgi:hypothetical protein